MTTIIECEKDDRVNFNKTKYRGFHLLALEHHSVGYFMECHTVINYHSRNLSSLYHI